MTDDLVKRLREDQPVTQDMESTIQCALQDEAADRIEALQAERCVEVRPLEWKPIIPGSRDEQAGTELGLYVVSVDSQSAGGTAYLWLAGQDETENHHSEYHTASEAKAAAQADYESRILPTLTSRPASEVRAEAHAAAIEAAVGIAQTHLDLVKPHRPDDPGPDDVAQGYGNASLNIKAAISHLHTDASLAYLAERDERIKREAREEALREAVAECGNVRKHFAMSSPESVSFGYEMAIDSLIEKDKDDGCHTTVKRGP